MQDMIYRTFFTISAHLRRIKYPHSLCGRRLPMSQRKATLKLPIYPPSLCLGCHDLRQGSDNRTVDEGGSDESYGVERKKAPSILDDVACIERGEELKQVKDAFRIKDDHKDANEEFIRYIIGYISKKRNVRCNSNFVSAGRNSLLILRKQASRHNQVSIHVKVLSSTLGLLLLSSPAAGSEPSCRDPWRRCASSTSASATAETSPRSAPASSPVAAR